MGKRLFGPALGLLAFAVVAGLFSFNRGSGEQAEANGAGAPQVRTGDVIVKFKSNATLADVGKAIDEAESKAIDNTGPSGLVLLEPEAGQSVDGALADLQADPKVEFAEADVVVSLVLTPTDPLYVTYQWHMGSTAAGSIGLPTAWNTTTGNASIIVAVIDTGVDAAHPDLAGKITTGANAGYNFVGNNTNTSDDHMHGTFVAGIIAANTNNGQGGAGVCWSCKIMPIKVLDNTGNGSSFNVSQGIDWAVSHGAKIVNLSLGGGAASSLSTSVTNAWNANVVVVAASGNDNGPVLYPAAYANAIAVGSNNSANAKSSFSNFGPELDVMAPGEDVMGTLCTCGVHSGGYGTGSGTSFAAPHVAGVAALIVATGVTDKQQIRDRLLTTATNMGAAGFDNLTGWGRVNAAAAVAGSAPYAVTWGSNTLPSAMTANATTNANVSFTNAGTLTWSAGGANPVRFSYHWRNGACPGTTTAVWDGERTNLAGNVAPTGTVSGLTAAIRAPGTAGTYCLQYDLVREGVTWFSTQGAATQTQTVSVTTPAYGITWGSNSLPTSVAAGSVTSDSVSFTNAGTLTWGTGGANPVRFSYHWGNGACPGSGYSVYDGLRTSLPGSIAQGQTVSSLNVSLLSPPSAGTYCLQYDLVREGVTWFSWQSAGMQQQTVTVTAPLYGVSWGSNTLPTELTANSTTQHSVSFANTGTLTWQSGGANPVRFAYHWVNGACPGTTFANYNGERTVLPGNVSSGGAVNSLNAQLKAPASAGTYCLQYDLVREGVTWFSWQGASMQQQTVTVSAPVYSVDWGSHNTPGTMSASSANPVTISFTNDGSLTWAAGGGNPVRLSYHWRNGACPGTTSAVFDGERTVLVGNVASGASVSGLAASVTAPSTPGTYCLVYDLVREGITWFSWQGAATLAVTVTVT